MERFLTGTILQPFIQPASVVKVLPCGSTSPTISPTGTPIASTSGVEYFLRGTEPAACPTPMPSPTSSPSETPSPSPTNQPTATPTDIPTPTAAAPTTTVPTVQITLPPAP